ncbi:MAG: hypothetical protein COY41_04975 [Candidatus Altarchaeum sp. CG_4_10_14_0_8_um_filter_32_851]|nr:MAG: hypothetical protein AUK59_05880 [Candidatus Altarchaeum sp. CG2_30_32_3053]PIZ29880.1 MAG: hypothetical protein COY41_04975 [Candidatus Altarchaeum sp. CG_4_10_14_0_8_um_filter_32_851]
MINPLYVTINNHIETKYVRERIKIHQPYSIILKSAMQSLNVKTYRIANELKYMGWTVYDSNNKIKKKNPLKKGIAKVILIKSR